MWQKAMAKVAEMQATHPEWDSLSQVQRLAVLHEEIDRLYPDVVLPLVPSKDDASRNVSCLACHDLLWVHPRGDHGNVAYGDVIPCPACGGWKEHKAQLALAASGIPAAKREYSFDSWHPVEKATEALDAVWMLACGKAEYKLLLVYGIHGCGKSHLAYACGREAASRGVRVRFVHCADLVQQSYGNTQLAELMGLYRGAEMLILDDLGAEQVTPYSASIMEALINHRYAEELPTLVTTNRDIKALPGPVLSRFRDARVSRIIYNEAPDYRPRNKGGN